MAKKKSSCCSCCGRQMVETFSLADAVICPFCAEKIRVMFPKTHIYRPDGPLTAHPFFHDCRHLSEKQLEGCIEEIINKQKGISSEYTVDKIHLLDLKTFMEYKNTVDRYRDNLRLAYDDYDNIFRVDTVRVLEKLDFKLGIQKMLKYKHTIALAGYVLAGKFREGDLVRFVCGGKNVEKEILFMYRDLGAPAAGLNSIDMRTKLAEEFIKSENGSDYIVEGFQYCVVIDWNGETPQPGDLLLSDD